MEAVWSQCGCVPSCLMFWTKSQVLRLRSVIWQNNKTQQQEAIYNLMMEYYSRDEEKFYFKL